MHLTTIFILFISIALIGAACYTANSRMLDRKLVQTPENGEQPKKDGKRTAVVVELFTSEGCSSCPPADKVLAILNRNHSIENVEVIALSQHVDYWNRLGWRDPFSSAQFSNRQGEYARFFGRNGGVYTPQMIVDGIQDFNGGDAGKALQAISKAAKEPKGDVSAEIEKLENNTAQLKIKIENLPKLSKNDRAIVILAVTEDNLSSRVTRGENSGSELQHAAVVRWMQNIGEIRQDGKTFAQTIVLDKSWKQENLNAVIFVQETGSRKILGATKIKL